MEDFTRFLKFVNNSDPDDPLLSATELGRCLSHIPLHHLVPAELSSLTQALNMEQLIPTESGLARDYRGLAELMGFGSAEIETRFKRAYNPTKSLIDAYTSLNLAQFDNNFGLDAQRRPVTVNNLLKLIEQIERFDVIDDFMPKLIDLANKYKPNEALSQQQLALVARSVQQDLRPNNSRSSEGSSNLVNNFTRLTVDDTQYNLIVYDAFVCFAPEDFHHAQELIATMEKYGKRLAVADDLLPGQFEFDALAQLIDSRCKKVIIILTPNFTLSRECEFQTKYASEIAIKAGYPKIIPVLYEACDDQMLPPMIRVISKIDMTNRNNTWQLNKLIRSLDFMPMKSILNGESEPRNSSPTVQHFDQQSSIEGVMKKQPLPGVDLSSQSQCPTPLIVLTDGSQSKFDSARTVHEPIVDLTHSESSMDSSGNSKSINLNNQTDANCSKGTTESHGQQKQISHARLKPQSNQHQPIKISNTMDRLRFFKQKMLASCSSSESTSSQAMLLRSTSPESEENVDRCSK